MLTNGGDMDARSLQVLEFPKLLTCLAGFAVSEDGARTCLKLSPSSSVSQIHFQNILFEQGSLWLEYSGFRVGSFPSLEGTLALLENGGQVLDLDDLCTLRHVLGQGRNLLASVLRDENNSSLWPDLMEFCRAHPLPEKSMQALWRCISEDGFLRDEASPELILARAEIRRIHQQCSRKTGDFACQHNLAQYLQDKYITLASDRYVLPLKSNFKGKFQGIIHDYSQTGETCYFEPFFLVDLNNRLQEVKRDEREAERQVYIYLSGLLRSEKEALDNVYDLMVKMDVLQAKRGFALACAGVMVRMGEDLPVNLRQARHPLLISAQTGASAAVPMDIILENGQKALIISGGNAGGKTVFLKTLGLIALMSLCSIPAPVASGSTIPVWKHILPFIGDDQSLEDHVSTFTAQITQLTANWSGLGPESLVILDEFGTGTDPSQGAALAQAVMDELMGNGAFVFAATHFPALKAYALSREGARAASVLFDPKTQKPLYQLAYDQVGVSQTLEVARDHGLPEEILKRARQYLLMDGGDSGRLWDRFNDLAVTREKEITALKVEREAYARRRDQLEERFARDREKLFTEIREQAQAVLRDWKAAKISHKQSLKQLAQVRDRLLLDEPGNEPGLSGAERPDLSRLLPGALLLYAPWNKTGVLLETDLRKQRARLDLSGISMWVEAADLFCSDRSAPGRVWAGGGVSLKTVSVFPLRLDLRGTRVEEALSGLASFIDSAILQGKEQLEIIHGRGTGALRREIHAYIKKHPQVRSFASANEDQGGDGVTLVLLK